MDDQDASVRRVDEDRWLASRFAPTDVRARLVALYAVTHEIARTSESVREPALGAIRLAWWRDAVAELYERQTVRAHPAFEAFANGTPPPPRAPLDAMIAARALDFEAAPFASWQALDDYLDATAGSVLRLAVALCHAPHADADAFAREAGLAWGYAGLLRAADFWRARGRNALPPGGTFDAFRTRGQAAFDAAGQMAPRLPGALFPAFGYVTLAPRYLRAPDKAQPLFARQLKLVIASATGRL